MDVEGSEADLADTRLDVVSEVALIEAASPWIEFGCGDVLLDELAEGRGGARVSPLINVMN